jgi:hypothetical protein
MKRLIVSILFLSLIIGGTSCGKDSDVPVVIGTTTINLKDSAWQDEATLAGLPNLPTLNIEKLREELSKTSEKKTFQAETGGKVEFDNDATLDIPANSCLNKDNQPCKGKVDIEVLFLKNKADLITNDKPTTSGGKLLVTGGIVYISAKQNGQELKLASGKPMKLRFKNSIPDANMRLFEGKSTDRFKFDWQQIPAAASNATVTTWNDPANRDDKGYEIVTDRFGWISCNKFHDEQNLSTKFSVILTDSFTNRNTSVYVVFKDINAVVKLEGNPSNKQFTIPNGYKGIPIGKVVTVVSISKFDDKISMLGLQEASVSSNANVKLSPQRYTAEKIKEKMKDL